MTAIADRFAIADVVAGLAHAQDDKDWDRFRTLFADRVVLDVSSHLGSPPVEMSAEELTAMAQGVINGFPFTQHLTANLEVEVDGERARCRTHTVAYHYFPTGDVDFCTMRGYWKLSLRRVSGVWRIDQWAVVRTIPLEGDERLYELAAAAARS